MHLYYVDDLYSILYSINKYSLINFFIIIFLDNYFNLLTYCMLI